MPLESCAINNKMKVKEKMTYHLKFFSLLLNNSA